MSGLNDIDSVRDRGRRPPASDRLLTALIDRIECGVLACGPQGELYHANRTAHEELQSGRTLMLCRDLVAGVGAHHEKWTLALRNAAARHRSSLLNLGRTPARLMVATLPLPVDGLEASIILVMMGRRNVCSPLGLEMLASNHGLTLAESRVLRALVGNASPREIAQMHGVAMATVRTQIQTLRDKLGVRSIDALLLCAAEVPPVTTRH